MDEGKTKGGQVPLTEGKTKAGKGIFTNVKIQKMKDTWVGNPPPMPSTRPPAPPRPIPPSGQGAANNPNSIPDKMLIATTCGELINIKRVESINLNQTEEDKVMGKLADDRIIIVRTVSGKDYKVSIKTMIELDMRTRTIEQMVQAIRGCLMKQ